MQTAQLIAVPPEVEPLEGEHGVYLVRGSMYRVPIPLPGQPEFDYHRYRVDLAGHGECGCQGFEFSKAEPKTCKHIRLATAWRKANQ